MEEIKSVVTKAKIKLERFTTGLKIACCSQLCTRDCVNFNGCKEYSIMINSRIGHDFLPNPFCRYYPCHFEGQSCLFCYCPLYTRQDCGGDFRITPKGIKDCSGCKIPHTEEGWKIITDKLTLDV